jgi:spore coat protein U-like protein
VKAASLCCTYHSSLLFDLFLLLLLLLLFEFLSQIFVLVMNTVTTINFASLTVMTLFVAFQKKYVSLYCVKNTFFTPMILIVNISVIIDIDNKYCYYY